MLRNYLKIAFRNLSKHKGYSFINIAGLSVGIASCILIALYVHNEWTFDQFHSRSDRIYRAWVREQYDNGDTYFNVATPLPLGPALEDNIPEAEVVTRVYGFTNLIRTSNDPQDQPEQIMMVDPSFFKIFDFNLLIGDKQTVFSTPGSVVLTTETARLLFGDRDPMQQTLSIKLGDQYKDFRVTGIIQAAPSNSSLQFGILIPFANAGELFTQEARDSWFNVFAETYVLLQENEPPDRLSGKLTAMMRQVLGDRYEESQYRVGFQPLKDIHLDTNYPTGLAKVSSPVYSYILSAIALLILAIACINFMTLSISRSTARAREVGVRKSVGAGRRHIMYQFWGEALLMTVLAFVLGVTLSELLLPFFNNLSGTVLELRYTWQAFFFFAGMILLVSFVSGIYPALVLSGFRPAEVLKGKLRMTGDQSFFRQSMVVFQFTLSIILMIGTLIVHKQMEYVRTTDLGYQKNQLLVLQSGISAGPKIPLGAVVEQGFRRKKMLESKLQSLSSVKHLSVSVFTPVQSAGWFNASFEDEQGQRQDFHFNIIDANFLNTMGIELVKGRGFSEKNISDQQRGLLVNEALVSHFGWKDPIGKRLPGSAFKDHEIIGVVRDFNYQSLHTAIEPLVLAMNPDLIFSGINNISINDAPTPRFTMSLQTGNLPATMDRLKNIWSEVAPGTPFDYTFVDAALDNQYRQEERLSKIVASGSILAIVIACLGLFGLATLAVVRRTKEIGIRKVLGASMGNVVLLVNKEFMRLIFIAFCIAGPAAWLVMHQWLKDFAYQATIGVEIFLVAGIVTFVVALVTVSWQSVQATLIDPVESLRSE